MGVSFPRKEAASRLAEKVRRANLRFSDAEKFDPLVSNGTGSREVDDASHPPPAALTSHPERGIEMGWAFGLLAFGLIALMFAEWERRQINKIIRDYHKGRRPCPPHHIPQNCWRWPNGSSRANLSMNIPWCKY